MHRVKQACIAHRAISCDFLFEVKKDPSNMTYGSTEMTLNKVSNQKVV